jgi:ribosomal protein S30
MTENFYPRFKNTRYYEIFWASPIAICQKNKEQKNNPRFENRRIY